MATTLDEEKEAPQQEEKVSFITIFFEGPGSARIVSLQTGEVSLNQVALAARELQSIADFEQWWGAYSVRMAQMEQEARQKLEDETIRKALMQGLPMRPS